MDLPRHTTSVGTRTDYTVGPWDYPTCAARVPIGVRCKDYGGEVLGYEAIHTMYCVEDS
jgi:hypothetical protein